MTQSNKKYNILRFFCNFINFFDYIIYMKYDHIFCYSKEKHLLWLLYKAQGRSIVICKSLSYANSIAKESALLLGYDSVRLFSKEFSILEQRNILNWFMTSKNPVLYITINDSQQRDFIANRLSNLYISQIIHTVLPSTAENYVEDLQALCTDQNTTATVLWNIRDTIWSTDFVYDLLADIPDTNEGEVVLRFIKFNNRRYTIDGLCYQLVSYLNNYYKDNCSMYIWTYKDCREIIDQLLIEEKIKICKWVFYGKVSINRKKDNHSFY